MKICLISKSDTKGGAAKVALLLAKGLVEEGHQVTMLVQTKSSDLDWVEELKDPQLNQRSLSQRVIHRLGVNALSLNSPFPKNRGSNYFSQFDVIHLHDLPDYFNMAHLPWLSHIRPVFWTLHTLNAFTGGCFYPYECKRYLKHCGKCPQFGKFPLKWLHRDGSLMILLLKKWIYRRASLNIICVSDWLAEKARQGIVNRFPVHTVKNPVDTNAFYPMDKEEAKKRLGIPPDKKTIMFAVAANLEDTRKGFDIVCEALKKLDIPDLFLMPTAISGESPQLQDAMHGKESLPPRHLGTDEDLRLYYNAADVVWHPTRADTSSMVGLEAIACGTPVIAAAVGGVREIVKDNINGLLIDSGSVESLIEATNLFFRGEYHFKHDEISTVMEHKLEEFIKLHLEMYRQVEYA